MNLKFLPLSECGSETENVFVLCANSRLHEARRKCCPHNSKYVLFVRRQDISKTPCTYLSRLLTVIYSTIGAGDASSGIPLEEGCGVELRPGGAPLVPHVRQVCYLKSLCTGISLYLWGLESAGVIELELNDCLVPYRWSPFFWYILFCT
jgi:hypothetical protein